ncbi:MAG: serine/threonine protein kinase [Solirubrobacterales bacterium]|nr:serine/threonine protein kinase [Solirubrobacterales bacterium]
MIDAGEDGGRPYIVLEYVQGETLKQRISRVGALDATEALAYALEVAQGLGVAHEADMVHRDVKPQNVLIDSTGRAKLTDFGISRQLNDEGVTATGRVIGTTDYVAPEQAMGKDIDTRSDIYSLGIVLFEMLTGDVPFEADNQIGVAMKHVNEPIPDVQVLRPDISAASGRVVDKSTAKDPDDRYTTIEDMAEDLQAALEVEAIRAGGTTGEATSVLDALPAPRRQLPSTRSSPWPAVVLLVIALVIAAGTAYVISRGDTGGGGGGVRGGGARVPPRSQSFRRLTLTPRATPTSIPTKWDLRSMKTGTPLPGPRRPTRPRHSATRMASASTSTPANRSKHRRWKSSPPRRAGHLRSTARTIRSRPRSMAGPVWPLSMTCPNASRSIWSPPTRHTSTTSYG